MPPSLSLRPSRLCGDLLMLASAWLYAGYMVLSRRWMQRLGELPVICWTFAAGGVMLAAVAPELPGALRYRKTNRS